MSEQQPLEESITERIESITQAENHVQLFLASFSELLKVIHDNKENPQSVSEYKSIVDSCYSHLSSSAIILRREVKLRDQIGIPPNLHKRATNINEDKINQLLN